MNFPAASRGYRKARAMAKTRNRMVQTVDLVRFKTFLFDAPILYKKEFLLWDLSSIRSRVRDGNCLPPRRKHEFCLTAVHVPENRADRGISGQTCIAVSWLKTACRAETPGSCQNITVERYAQILSCPQPAFRRLPFPGERTHDCFYNGSSIMVGGLDDAERTEKFWATNILPYSSMRRHRFHLPQCRWL